MVVFFLKGQKSVFVCLCMVNIMENQGQTSLLPGKTPQKTPGVPGFLFEFHPQSNRSGGSAHIAPLGISPPGPPSTLRIGRRMSKRLLRNHGLVGIFHIIGTIYGCLIFWVMGLNVYKPSPVMVGVWHWHVGSMIHHFVHCCLMNGMAHTSVAHRRCRRMRTTASSNVTWRGRQWGLAILAHRKQCGVTCPKNVEKSQWKLFMTPWYSIPNAFLNNS